MKNDLLIANFLRIAAEDLRGATLLAAASNRNAFYLCEQSAEKIIRAILTSESQHGGIKHHLDELIDLIPDENPLKPALREIEGLSAYATAWRYPTPGGRIPQPKGDLSGTLERVSSLLQETAARFQVELEKNTAAQNPAPIR